MLIAHPNPDGTEANTRQNAHGVDLNRNFPGWQPGIVGDTYYSGPGALSEPESKALSTFLDECSPTAVLTYHQHLNIIDSAGSHTAEAKEFARLTRIPFQPTTAYPGSFATWLGRFRPNVVTITVELPQTVDLPLVQRNVSAVLHLANNK